MGNMEQVLANQALGIMFGYPHEIPKTLLETPLRTEAESTATSANRWFEETPLNQTLRGITVAVSVPDSRRQE
jgi:hypothetical protein